MQRLIAIEGIDGSGKSTLALSLKQFLEEKRKVMIGLKKEELGLEDAKTNRN
ncbi:MAG: hypothetical protein QXR34_00345 [Saccharolobus sp.]